MPGIFTHRILFIPHNNSYYGAIMPVFQRSCWSSAHRNHTVSQDQTQNFELQYSRYFFFVHLLMTLMNRMILMIYSIQVFTCMANWFFLNIWSSWNSKRSNFQHSLRFRLPWYPAYSSSQNRKVFCSCWQSVSKLTAWTRERWAGLSKHALPDDTSKPWGKENNWVCL